MMTQPPLKLSPRSSHPGAGLPAFEVKPLHEITASKTIVFKSIQIQYSQMGFLSFASPTWPHVSVVTLVPTTEPKVSPSAWN